MADGDAISISSGEEPQERRAILEPAILNVVNALGGYEGGVYRLGDEAYGCLKDLKKFWRKDETDDERTVARILWASRVLPNDLVPIILETAGKGHVEDKRAIACADLITAMTWPIDLAEELKELDEEFDRGTDYTQLLQSHLHYKAALLRPGVLPALFSIVLPCLARGPQTRTERDVQIVNVVLHLVRNLAFIKDLPANVHLSADQAELASLQSKLIRTLSESNFLDLLLTVASSAASDAMFNAWNALQTRQNLRQLLTTEDRRRRDFARKAPSRHSRFGTTISVRLNPKKVSGGSGAPADGDAGNPVAPVPDTTSTPSPSSSQPLVLHRQQALSKESGAVIDLVKRQNKQKGKKEDEVARNDNLTPEARTVLRGLARTFLESCFNRTQHILFISRIFCHISFLTYIVRHDGMAGRAAFLASLLKDIKSERPKITEKDNLRLLFVTKWFLEYFLAVRAQEKGAGAPEPWAFGLVGEVIERSWIVWVLKRMNSAVEEKVGVPSPASFLLLLIHVSYRVACTAQVMDRAAGWNRVPDAAARAPRGDGLDGHRSGEGTELHEAADLLRQQLVYNGQVLDAALDGLRVYKDGTQSLAFLRSSVHLAYALMRMLEKWAKATGDGSYVRKRSKPKKARRATVHSTDEPDGVPDAEEEEAAQAQADDEVIQETMFTFESFELKFANSDITQSLLTYLGRYKEFTSPEEMKRVVSLLHRQAVRAKAEGLFFQVSALNLFKTILVDQKSFPKDQPYKDLVALINYVLRQFFKAVEADSFVLIEAFFPKNRNRWKRYSSWEPEPKTKDKEPDARFPPDVQVKKGFSWSEQLAIAMAALQEAGQSELIEWVKEILTIVIAQRHRIEERAKDPAQDASDDEGEAIGGEDTNPSTTSFVSDVTPSKTAADYMIPYTTDAQANAATKNPQLKLMFRLVHAHVQDEDADELEWYIPAGIDLPDLQRSLTVIEQFEETPLDLNGKRASQLLCKKRQRRRRRRRERTRRTASGSEGEAAASGGDDNHDDDDEEDDEDRPRRARKVREREQYKSAQFIEDSDEEYGQDIDDFFVREAELRKRTALAAVDSQLSTMRPTGTKKRRRAQPPLSIAAKGRLAKRRAVLSTYDNDNLDVDNGHNDSLSRPSLADRDAAAHDPSGAPVVPKAQARRPRARPQYRGAAVRAPDATSDTPRRDGDDGNRDRSPRGSPVPSRVDEDDSGRPASSSSSSGALRKGRLIISDEE
ncbi:timeless protein-domain-containing protein [Russula brevipes]|nr:timeless protein-domain-containing protein [Russula brevipes]